MKLHKEAFPTVFYAAVIYALSILGVWRLFHAHKTVYTIWFWVATILLLVTFWFFRKPVKKSYRQPDACISPAFGRILTIEKCVENNYLKCECLCISIFMSPLNVHVNYIPIDGDVAHVKHHTGNYLLAFHPKASSKNEHVNSVISGKVDVLVKQIAGFFARRIVNYMHEGSNVQQGDELGFIKWGSRTQVYLPLTAKINVAVGDIVRGGQTVLAFF